MARSLSLLSPEPSNIVSQPVTIGHMCVGSLNSLPSRYSHSTSILFSSQLRDLIICPDERGVVNFVHDQCIMERDISDPSSVRLPVPLRCRPH